MMEKQTMWWGVESTNDPDVKIFHSRLKLLEKYATFAAQANMTFFNDAHTGEQHEITGVPRLLLDIRGVAAVSLTAYTVTVVKVKLVDWHEIEHHIIELLYGVKQAVTLPVFDVKELGEAK